MRRKCRAIERNCSFLSLQKAIQLETAVDLALSGGGAHEHSEIGS